MKPDLESPVCFDKSLEPMHQELVLLLKKVDKIRDELGYSPRDRQRLRYAICGEYEVWQETDGLGKATITVEDDAGKIYWTATVFEAQLDQLLSQLDQLYPDSPD